MKINFAIGLAIFVSAATTQAAALSYAPNDVSPLRQVSAGDRAIEPTSPILGYQLSENLRGDDESPEEIIQKIQTQDPDWQRQIAISTIAFFDVLFPGLQKTCAEGSVDTAPPAEGWTQVINAAIPLQILVPLHADYQAKISALSRRYANASLEELQAKAREMATVFEDERLSCASVKHMVNLADHAGTVCDGAQDLGEAVVGQVDATFDAKNHSCASLAELNLKIMSPEASYPRIQFSVNGFTRYVYLELFAHPRLGELLKQTFEASNRWMALANESSGPPPFSTYVLQSLEHQGFSGRDTLLVLSYATRNMPSLDVQYGFDSEKALLLETYFWKFHAVRDYLQKDIKKVFWENEMDQDPGIYHYFTAALQACDVLRAGFSREEAWGSAVIQSVGYKTSKSIAAFDLKQAISQGKKYLKQYMIDQGFDTGVEAGIYGGDYGLELCGKN